MSEIREYRSRETLGDAYTKPYAYEQLIEDNVQEPFIRKIREEMLSNYL